MDYYPAEVATPPLALVALLGCPGLHGIVGEFLRAAHKPPINSLGIGDPAMAGRIFGENMLVRCHIAQTMSINHPNNILTVPETSRSVKCWCHDHASLTLQKKRRLR